MNMNKPRYMDCVNVAQEIRNILLNAKEFGYSKSDLEIEIEELADKIDDDHCEYMTQLYVKEEA
jgi:hypothetical protein